MELLNDSPFPALDFKSVDNHGQAFHVVVARATFRIEETGALEPAAEQGPLVMADEYYGSFGTSSVKDESDLSPYKPQCDVVVIGDAVAPGGAPAERFIAGIDMGRHGIAIINKRIAVTGPRFWEKRGILFGGWKLTEPEPIQSLPIRYEFAYGGECKINHDDPAAGRVAKTFRLTPEQRAAHPDGAIKAPMAHTCFGDNSIGRGYAEKWYLKARGLRRIPAAQIESVNDPIKDFSRPYEPQGLGFRPKSSSSRIAFAGTMDESFIQSGKSLPEDFQFAYWNGAPADMQIPWPEGSEEITLTNIGGVSRVVLPGQRICAEVHYPDRHMAALDFNADTLIINAEQKTVSLVYRLKVPPKPEMRSLEIQWLSGEERAILKEHVEAVNRQVVEYQKAFQEVT